MLVQFCQTNSLTLIANSNSNEEIHAFVRNFFSLKKYEKIRLFYSFLPLWKTAEKFKKIKSKLLCTQPSATCLIILNKKMVWSVFFKRSLKWSLVQDAICHSLYSHFLLHLSFYRCFKIKKNVSSKFLCLHSVLTPRCSELVR